MMPVNACTLFSTPLSLQSATIQSSVVASRKQGMQDTVAPSQPKVNTPLPSSSPSSSTLAFPESTISNSSDGLNGSANEATKSERAEYDDLLPLEVTDFGWKMRKEPRPELAPKSSLREEDLQHENARTEQKPFAERDSSFVVEEKSDDDVELDSQASPMHLTPMVDSAERERLKLTLSQAASALPSPFSPSESVRPLTPPFPETDEPELLQDVSSSLVSSVTVTADDGRSRKAGRTHLAIDVSPTNDVGYLLFPPLLMSDQRRYSLVDLGSVTAPTASRRTLSDVGACTTSLRPQTGLPSNNASEELESGPESRTSSPPSTARFSTFAEMGIQSFAMAKGGKTVDSKKKGADAYEKRRHKKDDVTFISKERNRHFLEPTNLIFAQEKDVVVLESPEIKPDAIVVHAEAHHKPKKHRSPKSKSPDCIIM
ncbi:hypothetical protein A7U60_g1406 [Sanghuangporus baumii]|uniref:Uncharacterized protein n=1 Tax=Sanghuangporus baumii TaxID=108892 RepID=A0A9Q5N9B3_SANBA|nr:hypothetical protein A7U60_g1406 [Sanghuangporus baumii]